MHNVHSYTKEAIVDCMQEKQFQRLFSTFLLLYLRPASSRTPPHQTQSKLLGK